MRTIRTGILGLLAAAGVTAGVTFAHPPAGAEIDDIVQCEEPDEGIGPPPADQCPDHPPVDEPTEPTEPTEPEAPEAVEPLTPVSVTPHFTG